MNQVRYNRSRALVASSGVEKVVKLWSCLPLPLSGNSSTLNTERERRVYSHEEYIGLVLREGSMISHDYSSESTKENPRMMAFFDSLVQREIEGWNTSDGETENSDSEEYSNMVEDGDESDTVSYTRRERSAEESGIQSSSSASTSASSSFLSSSSSSSSRQDSGLETAQASTDRDGASILQDSDSPNRIFSDPPPQVEAETQTPPQSSQNLIADLIAKKRTQLMRRCKKAEESEREDGREVARILQCARRALRSDSNNSSSSVSVSSQEETLPGPSGSSGVISRLRKKRARLAANKSDSESDVEESRDNNITEETLDSPVRFRKLTNKQRNIREKSSDESD